MGVQEELAAAMAHYRRLSQRIPGWTRGEEAQAVLETCLSAPDDAVIVEIGAFFGCSTVLMAGARKIRGSGRVHSVDPFNGSGDDVSEPHYAAILLAFAGRSQREHFDDNIELARLADYVVAHEGGAAEVAATWSTPVDVLFLDGDQSPAGAREAYDAWIPWLKPGGTIVLHNSVDREYESGHEGHWLLVTEEIRAGGFDAIRVFGSSTFARKRADAAVPALRPRRSPRRTAAATS